jgi:hypothetical protein
MGHKAVKHFGKKGKRKKRAEDKPQMTQMTLLKKLAQRRKGRQATREKFVLIRGFFQ